MSPPEISLGFVGALEGAGGNTAIRPLAGEPPYAAGGAQKKAKKKKKKKKEEEAAGVKLGLDVQGIYCEEQRGRSRSRQEEASDHSAGLHLRKKRRRKEGWVE